MHTISTETILNALEALKSQHAGSRDFAIVFGWLDDPTLKLTPEQRELLSEGLANL